MDQYDLDVEEKNIIGGIDRLIVNFGMAFIAIVPTYFYLIFKPKAMCYMLKGEEADGRQGLKLGPGITFIFTIFVILGIGYFMKEVTGTPTDPDTPSGNGLRVAISEGNFWRSILLSLPFYITALFFGVMFHVAHRVIRRTSNLTLSIGVGLYIVSTVLLIVIASAGIANVVSGGGDVSGWVAFPILSAFLVIMPYQVFSFSRHAFGTHPVGAVGVTVIFMILFFVTFAALVGVVSIGSPADAPAPIQ